MRKPRRSSTGIDGYVEGFRYVVVRPNGRPSRVSFGHPFRAADHAMRAFKLDSWTPLAARGFTVQGIKR